MLTLDDTPYHSTLLDKDGQPVSKGIARFYKAQSEGAFWPQVPTDAGHIQANAKTLKMIDGHGLKIQVVGYIHSEMIDGGHFAFQLIPDRD